MKEDGLQHSVYKDVIELKFNYEILLYIYGVRHSHSNILAITFSDLNVYKVST